MNREIKFRAWDVSCSRMMSPSFGVNCSELWKWCDENGFECELPEHLMQYTGLKDKNGKEIYESDYVDWRIGESPEGRYLVEWYEYGWFLAKDGHREPLYTNMVNSLEVIGNKYENN